MLTKEDKAGFKMMYQKISENSEILQRIVLIFSQLINYDIMLREIYIRMERERLEATRELQVVEDEMRGMLRAQGLDDCELDKEDIMATDED